MRVERRHSWVWGPCGFCVALSCAAAAPSRVVTVRAAAGSTPLASSRQPSGPPESGAVEPVATEPAALEPAPAHCKPALDPAPEAWESHEGCSVTFKLGRVVEERSCTKATCGDRDCCNQCSAGGLALYSGGVSLQLSSSKAPLTCREGRDCTAYRDCEVPPGGAEVTGVLRRRDGRWSLDARRFVHRVGQCSQRSVGLIAELSPTDRCRASFDCDDGREVSVSCDGENDGTDTSLCECELDGRTRPLPNPIRGEAPFSCERALELCLAATQKR